MNAHAHPVPLFLTAEEAETARDAAWDRYLTTPHANPKVGLDRYHRELAEIAKLERA